MSPANEFSRNIIILLAEQPLLKKIKDAAVSSWREEIYGLADVILIASEVHGTCINVTVPEQCAVQLYYTEANLDRACAKICSAYLISHLVWLGPSGQTFDSVIL